MIDAVAMGKFKLGESDLGTFELLLEDVDPNDRQASFGKAKQSFHGQRIISGIYIWVMSWNGSKYGVYIGSSSDIVGRLSNYTGAFQPHSPNNFKIRCYHDFMKRQFPGASLGLYCQSQLLDRKELYKYESRLINKLKPLINRLPSLSESRLEIQKRFCMLYEESFTKIIEETQGSEEMAF